MSDLDRIENMTPEEAARGNLMAAVKKGGPLGWSIFGPTLAGRACGHCTFCCIVVPVEAPLDKPGNVRCVHLKHKGCSIYRQRPDVCAAWKCAWLYQPEAKVLKRPDHAGYAVDCCLQEIFINQQLVHVIQVWGDPDRREAHKAPELLAYLALMAEKHRLPAIVRWPMEGKDQSADEATVLFAPCLTNTGRWEEITSGMIPWHEMERLKKERT